MGRKKSSPTGGTDWAREKDIQRHRDELRTADLIAGQGPERRPRARAKYEPAPMPKDADIDAALARIRGNRLTASAGKLKQKEP